MAHLSERHGNASRRRDELLRERAQVTALRAGYPEVSLRPRQSLATCTPNTTVVVVSDKAATRTAAAAAGSREESSHSNRRRRTPEEMAEFSRQCEERVARTREKESLARRAVLADEQERRTRSQQAGEAAPALAAERLRERREQKRRAAEADLEALVDQQESSLEAMNIARMLSPRFQDRVQFVPSVVQYSAEDERVKHLLANSRVGSYYQ